LSFQYSVWTDITPKVADTFFKGTQFSGGSWHEFMAVERFVFSDGDQAARFWREKRTSIAGSSESDIRRRRDSICCYLALGAADMRHCKEGNLFKIVQSLWRSLHL
ncbi:hypothetical protein diail_223, partial [Diaporthe ilicicola]